MLSFHKLTTNNKIKSKLFADFGKEISIYVQFGGTKEAYTTIARGREKGKKNSLKQESGQPMKNEDMSTTLTELQHRLVIFSFHEK